MIKKRFKIKLVGKYQLDDMLEEEQQTFQQPGVDVGQQTGSDAVGGSGGAPADVESGAGAPHTHQVVDGRRRERRRGLRAQRPQRAVQEPVGGVERHQASRRRRPHAVQRWRHSAHGGVVVVIRGAGRRQSLQQRRQNSVDVRFGKRQLYTKNHSLYSETLTSFTSIWKLVFTGRT